MADETKIKTHVWIALSLRNLKLKSKNVIPKYILTEDDNNTFDMVKAYFPFMRVNGESYC